MKKIICRLIPGVILLVLMLCHLVSCFCEPDDRKPETVIGEMVSLYGETGDLLTPEIGLLTAVLWDMDPVQADLWHGILTYWDQLNRTPVSSGRLPEGLPEDRRLCIVILGYQLDPDGEIRPELEGRLRTGLLCAQQYPEAYVLCTGGATASGNREATEAEMMGAWLKENGLEAERLILEKDSMSTTDNAVYSAEILQNEYPEVDTVVIVSSAYHIPWGQLLYEAVFRMNTALDNAPEIHAVANAAYMVENPAYGNTLGHQMSGLNSLIRHRYGPTYPPYGGN